MTVTSTPPRPFDQAWSFADTMALLEKPPFPQNATAAQQQLWRQEVGEPGDRKLAGAIGEHVAWLMEQGREVIPANADGIETAFLHHLRQLAGDPANTQFHVEAGMPFVRHTLVHLALDGGRDGHDGVRIHEGLVDLVKAGNFKGMGGDDGACWNTGLRISVNIEGWSGIAGTRKMVPDPDRAWGRMVFEPLDPATVVSPRTHACVIPVPSGQLWIADWFRIKAFNELTKPVDEDESPEALQSIHGRAQRAVRYAEQLGIGHVPFKSPDVVSSQGAITGGHYHRDEQTGEERLPAGHLGSIHADLRWTTVVDRKHLIDLLAAKLGQEQAARVVDDYEANTPDIIKVSVEPGQYHLYFAGDGRTMGRTIAQQFHSDGLFLEEDYEQPGFALTRQPLPEVVAKPASKAGPRAG